MLRYLVFSGGGIRGMAYIGVLKAIEEQKLHIEGCAGSSAGAIISALFLLGYSSSDLLTELRDNIDLASLVSVNLVNIFSSFGLDDGSNFEMQLKDLIIKKGFDENITLREFHYKTNKILHIVATCLDNQTCVILNHITFPCMKLVTAVRISSALPGLFSPVKYQGKMYADGSLTNHFPMNIFPEEHQVGFFLEQRQRNNLVINNIFDYLRIVVDTITRSKHTGHDWDKSNRIIIIPSSLDVTNFQYIYEEIVKDIYPAYESTIMWFHEDLVPCTDSN
jgi:predicted acylesterase/phospholipase RssA